MATMPVTAVLDHTLSVVACMLERIRSAAVVNHVMAIIIWMLMKIPGAQAPTKCPKEAFLPDEELRCDFIYSVITCLFYRWAQLFHAYTADGLEKLPPEGEGCLFVSMHTTHNVDVLTCATMLASQTGRAPRGLLHRRVYQCSPWVKYVGLVPGDRQTAVNLLKQGFMAACLPGGSEEAMVGHENAYALHERWNDRRGYAHVAKEAGVRIFPFFTQNVEEMRFNPTFWLCNKLRIGQAYNVLQSMPVLGNVVKSIATAMWFLLSYATAIPVPVKITTFIGDPIETRDMSVDEIAAATRLALQTLIDEKQPHGHAYMPGLRSRLLAGIKTD